MLTVTCGLMGAVTPRGRVYYRAVVGNHLLQCTQLQHSFGNSRITFSLFQLDSSCEICGRNSIKQVIHSFTFWLCWVLMGVCRLPQLQPAGAALQRRCSGLSLRWRLLLQSMGSRTAGLQQLQLMGLIAPGRWGLPGPGSKLMSPAAQGGFLTTGPPGKPLEEIPYSFWHMDNILPVFSDY